jgi:hypothetical protein
MGKTKKTKTKAPRKQYWEVRADNGVSYILSEIDNENCNAAVRKIQNGFPAASYRIIEGECECRGFQYRGQCSHIGFLSCIVDGKEVSMSKARAICATVTAARDFKTFKAEVIEYDDQARLLHIQATAKDLPYMRVVEWYSGLPVVTDVNLPNQKDGDGE